MNLDRLNKLNDLLDECDSRINSLIETAMFLKPIDEITGGNSGPMFAKRAESTQAAKRRILQSIRREMNILRTQLNLEINEN